VSTEWLKTNLRHRAKTFLGRHPRLYRWVFQNRDGYSNRMVTDATDLCIEGFPRSANSFAVGAFEQAQSQPVQIAHHNHVPAPLLDACRRGLPTMVLIRDPVEAVISNRGLQLQIGAVEDKPMPMHVSFETQLKAWHSFYDTVWPKRDQVVIAPFETVTDDFGPIIDQVNTRFGTEFDRFDHTDANVDAIRSTRGYHALPSGQRTTLKQQARDRFANEVGTDHPLVDQTRTLYTQYIDHAKPQAEHDTMKGNA